MAEIAPAASIFDAEPETDVFGFERRACATRLILRGKAALKAIGLAFGTGIPTIAMTSTSVSRRAALWLGPDEWLLLADDEAPARLASHLGTAAGKDSHAIVDVSHRQQAVLVCGKAAAHGLNATVPIDLSLDAFPVNRSTRTLFEKMGIVLWRRSEHCFQIEAERSYLPYLTDHLALIESDVKSSRR